MNDIGEKIYRLREENDLSQEELAEKLNVSRPTISRWENNAVQPTMENIKSLCEIFNVTSSYFFNNVEETAVTKEVQSAQTEPIKEVKKEKFKNLKIVLTVVGIVLLVLFIIACGIACYVTISPSSGKYVDSVYIVNYTGITFLIIGILAVAILITVITIIIKKRLKRRKNKNCNTVSANCNKDVTDK